MGGGEKQSKSHQMKKWFLQERIHCYLFQAEGILTSLEGTCITLEVTHMCSAPSSNEARNDMCIVGELILFTLSASSSSNNLKLNTRCCFAHLTSLSPTGIQFSVGTSKFTCRKRLLPLPSCPNIVQVALILTSVKPLFLATHRRMGLSPDVPDHLGFF